MQTDCQAFWDMIQNIDALLGIIIFVLTFMVWPRTRRWILRKYTQSGYWLKNKNISMNLRLLIEGVINIDVPNPAQEFKRMYANEYHRIHILSENSFSIQKTEFTGAWRFDIYPEGRETIEDLCLETPKSHVSVSTSGLHIGYREFSERVNEIMHELDEIEEKSKSIISWESSKKRYVGEVDWNFENLFVPLKNAADIHLQAQFKDREKPNLSVQITKSKLVLDSPSMFLIQNRISEYVPYNPF